MGFIRMKFQLQRVERARAKPEHILEGLHSRPSFRLGADVGSTESKLGIQDRHSYLPLFPFSSFPSFSIIRSVGAAKQPKHENNSEKIVRKARRTGRREDGTNRRVCGKSFGSALPPMEADYVQSLNIFHSGSCVKPQCKLRITIKLQLFSCSPRFYLKAEHCTASV